MCQWGLADVKEEDADCRNSGEQLKSEEDGEVGGLWTVGNVEGINEEEQTIEIEHIDVR